MIPLVEVVGVSHHNTSAMRRHRQPERRARRTEPDSPSGHGHIGSELEAQGVPSPNAPESAL